MHYVLAMVTPALPTVSPELSAAQPLVATGEAQTDLNSASFATLLGAFNAADSAAEGQLVQDSIAATSLPDAHDAQSLSTAETRAHAQGSTPVGIFDWLCVVASPGISSHQPARITTNSGVRKVGHLSSENECAAHSSLDRIAAAIADALPYLSLRIESESIEQNNGEAYVRLSVRLATLSDTRQEKTNNSVRFEQARPSLPNLGDRMQPVESKQYMHKQHMHIPQQSNFATLFDSVNSGLLTDGGEPMLNVASHAVTQTAQQLHVQQPSSGENEALSHSKTEGAKAFDLTVATDTAAFSTTGRMIAGTEHAPSPPFAEHADGLRGMLRATITAMFRNGIATARLVLHPESLGTVVVHLSTSASGTAVQIVVSSAETLAAVERTLTTLHADLTSAGVPTEAIVLRMHESAAADRQVVLSPAAAVLVPAVDNDATDRRNKRQHHNKRWRLERHRQSEFELYM
ncbi:MAG: flagellar hook-length control protein FliK [Chlorobi bacterium]|nr:flagellar hook-length control protein FliK [Chlorobiota bacterium]